MAAESKVVSRAELFWNGAAIAAMISLLVDCVPAIIDFYVLLTHSVGQSSPIKMFSDHLGKFALIGVSRYSVMGSLVVLFIEWCLFTTLIACIRISRSNEPSSQWWVVFGFACVFPVARVVTSQMAVYAVALAGIMKYGI